jgi:carbon monoxide dehydrogenase subunit G
MKLQNEFEVAVPVDEVWPALLDIERVAQFLPGAVIEPTDEDGVYKGSMKVKLGPMVVTYKGTARLGAVDEGAHSAAIEVEAREIRGQGGAAATIVNRLVDLDDGGTRVVAETDLRITGRQAQFGRGIMQDVAGSMLGDFAKRFEASLLGKDEAPAPAGNGATPAAGAERPAPTPPEEVEALDMGAVISGTRMARYGAAAAAGLLVLLILRKVLRRG